MESTIIGEFDTRGAELAVEHVVQECGVPRTDVFVQPVGDANTERPAGADAKAAPAASGHQKLEGSIEVSVDLHGDDPQKIASALKNVGAKAVRTK